jgi:hypothetical protein
MIYTKEQLFRKQINDYIINLKYLILTSRFNNQTWEENEQFREKYKNVGCIYCSPSPLSNDIPNDMALFILEMNNDMNRIMGIGMVTNHPKIQKFDVYENGNFNRFSFIGKNRIDRSEMTEEEDQIFQVFDILCFKGNKHMKRGQGLTMFPSEMLYRLSFRVNLVDFIKEMFKKRFYS